LKEIIENQHHYLGCRSGCLAKLMVLKRRGAIGQSGDKLLAQLGIGTVSVFIDGRWDYFG